MRTSILLCVARSPAVLVALILAGCIPKPPPPGPPVVKVTTPIQRDVPIYGEWVGTLDGYVNAQIRAQVSGYLLSQNYRDGTSVKKGDVLFQIDPRPFQAKLDQAQATLGKTELDVKRLTPLAKENAVSQQELDDAVQANLANQAAVEQARLNLEFTTIVSPIDGLAEIASAQIGDLVGPTGGPLTTVSQLDPIKVNFTVSEQAYLGTIQEYLEDMEKKPAVPKIELELILADGKTYPMKGRARSADRQVDPRTGAIRVVGEFPNVNYVLRPGQFARVRAVVRLRQNALLIPQRAVSELQGLYQVAVVGPDNRASVRTVEMGERFENLWIVEEGINPGDRVVVEGIQKARDGVIVSPEPFASPPPAAASPPAN